MQTISVTNCSFDTLFGAGGLQVTPGRGDDVALALPLTRVLEAEDSKEKETATSALLGHRATVQPRPRLAQPPHAAHLQRDRGLGAVRGEETEEDLVCPRDDGEQQQGRSEEPHGELGCVAQLSHPPPIPGQPTAWWLNLVHQVKTIVTKARG